MNALAPAAAFEPRFVTCDNCNGYGAIAHRITVYEAGCGFPHDDTEETPCPDCNGEGCVEVDCYAAELDDDQQEPA